jgi:hypothetical protein
MHLDRIVNDGMKAFLEEVPEIASMDFEKLRWLYDMIIDEKKQIIDESKFKPDADDSKADYDEMRWPDIPRDYIPYGDKRPRSRSRPWLHNNLLQDNDKDTVTRGNSKYCEGMPR